MRAAIRQYVRFAIVLVSTTMTTTTMTTTKGTVHCRTWSLNVSWNSSSLFAIAATVAVAVVAIPLPYSRHMNFNGWEIWSRNNYRSTFCHYIQLKRQLIAIFHSMCCNMQHTIEFSNMYAEWKTAFHTKALPRKYVGTCERRDRFAVRCILLQNKTWTTTFQNVKWKQKLSSNAAVFCIRMQRQCMCEYEYNSFSFIFQLV